MMKKYLLFLLIIVTSGYCSDYQFNGTHYIASYINCDHGALTDLPALEKAMLQSVKACGAKVLDTTKYVFPPDGITMILLLSESHASIHTYPEYNSCYIDLFTCGESCDYRKFEERLKAYLCPESIDQLILER